MSTGEQKDRAELPQGTPDLLILRPLLLGAAHRRATAKAKQMEQGSLCPALHRLIKRGWTSAEEGISENNRRVKF
jgi:hypothetical protein